MKKALLFAFAATLVAGLAPGASALHRPSTTEKKKCKIVVKIVHGQKRKVRVCHTVKPTSSRPSSVSVTLDSARASTASITPAAGGTVNAGGATLTVPAGAVSSTTSVTITPVTKVSGLPGKVLGAVQFEPDGLQLAKPVTLTFAVSSTSGLKAFSYAGNGTALHLYPVKVAGGKATLELTHFSGYGVGQGLPPPSVTSLRTELNTIVRPEAKRAMTHSGVFEQAARDFSSWKKEVGLFPPAERAKYAKDIDEIAGYLEVGFKRFVDDEHSDCVKDHDLRALDNIARAKAILIFDIGETPPDLLTHLLAYADERFRGCGQFELDFDSVITNRTSIAYFVSHVRVQKLKLNFANSFSNQAPLDYVDFSATIDDGCSTVSSTDVYELFKATIDDLDAEHATGIGAQPHPKVTVFVGTAKEHIDSFCPYSLPAHLPDNYYWQRIDFFHNHGGSFAIDPWDTSGGASFGHKVYRQTFRTGSVTVTEVTTFDLTHVPQ